MNAVRAINAALKKAGRDERLVRGKGYWYLSGGDAGRLRESGFYGYHPALISAEASLRMIQERFADNGVTVRLTGEAA